MQASAGATWRQRPTPRRPLAAAIPVVTLKVTEAGLEAPGEIPSGVVAVTVEGGNPENMPELARLNDGVTMDQLNEALAQPDPMAALPLVIAVRQRQQQCRRAGYL